jgi:hypothetical protein
LKSLSEKADDNLENKPNYFEAEIHKKGIGHPDQELDLEVFWVEAHRYSRATTAFFKASRSLFSSSEFSSLGSEK